MTTEEEEPPRVITLCAALCGKQVLARKDGKAYLCRSCWSSLFSTLFEIIRTAPEPLITVHPTSEQVEPSRLISLHSNQQPEEQL